MITLHGTYADECNGPLPDKKLTFVCRVFRYKDKWYDGVGQDVEIKFGDVLLTCGNESGFWWALFRES